MDSDDAVWYELVRTGAGTGNPSTSIEITNIFEDFVHVISYTDTNETLYPTDSSAHETDDESNTIWFADIMYLEDMYPNGYLSPWCPKCKHNGCNVCFLKPPIDPTSDDKDERKRAWNIDVLITYKDNLYKLLKNINKMHIDADNPVADKHKRLQLQQATGYPICPDDVYDMGQRNIATAWYKVNLSIDRLNLITDVVNMVCQEENVQNVNLLHQLKRTSHVRFMILYPDGDEDDIEDYCREYLENV